MNWKEFLFGKSEKRLALSDYPLKDAKHSGWTFNDWRKANGYKLVERSVPDEKLTDYCIDCGWPSKFTWQQKRKLPSGFMDAQNYVLWLKFIVVLDPDRLPEDSKAIIDYLKQIK